MTKTMWEIVNLLYNLYLVSEGGGHLAAWHLEDEIGVKFSGCGVPDGDNAIEELVKLGLIEEVPNLGCRYRIVVRDGAE